MRNILYILTAAFAGLILSQSCSLKDQYETTRNNYTGNGVEFIARPVGFNNQTVETKSSADNLEKKVCNCYFLVFDSNGDRVYFSGGEAEYLRSFRVPKDVCSMGLLTACYLVNVPSTFAENIIGLTKPADAPATDNNKYINTAVIENLTYDYSLENGIPMGTPIIDGKSCIPMFGKAQFNPNNTTVCEISIKRLFAKVTINISLSLDLSSWEDELMQSSTYYKLNSYNLHNLPTKVCLEEKATESESDWAEDKSSFTYTDNASNPSDPLSQSIVYNKNGNYEFSFYVPEFYLNPKAGADDNQKNKPQNYRVDETFPVYVTLHGTYTEYSYRAASMKHYIYLGRNQYSDFSFARNAHYTNYITIKGVTGSTTNQDNLDWRVVTDVIHNPVEVEGKSANCYILKEATKYSFPAYKGAYNNLKNAEFCNGDENSSVEQIASDNSDIKITELKYNKDDNFISFKIENIEDGNVVIALKNGDGSTEWSWHLWCSTSSVIGDWFQNITNMSGAWGDMGFQTYPNGSKMMDRNLGAISATITLLNQNDAIGAYYKSGHKEPYIGGDYRGGGSITNPDGTAVTQTWDSVEKSPTDPCPPGYRIPQSSAFAGNATNEDAPLLGAFRFWNNNSTVNTTDDIYFPYSGYIDAQKSKQSGVGTDTEYTSLSADLQISDIRTNEVQIGEIQYHEQYLVIRYEEKELGYNEYRYNAFQYNSKLKTNKVGSFIASENSGVQYYVKGSNWTDFHITQCKRQVRQVKRKVQRFYRYENTGSFFRPNYQWVLSEDWHEIVSPQASDWADDGTITSDTQTYISNNTMGYINNETWLNSLKSNQSSREFEDLVEQTSMNTNFGYQIRCIKE